MLANSLRFFLSSVVLLGVLLHGSERTGGAIGFVAPKPADFGRHRASPDLIDFFDEFALIAYDNIQDAGTTVMRKHNYTKGSVSFHDIEYDGVILIPEEENFDAIEDFYRHLSRRKLAKVAEQNRVDFILYSRFDKSNIRRILVKKPKKATVILKIFVYNAQNSATSNRYVKVNVEDIFTAPDYDRDAFQDQIVAKYEEAFNEMLGSLEITGSGYTEEKRVKEEKKTDRKQEQIDAAEEAGSGDW